MTEWQLSVSLSVRFKSTRQLLWLHLFRWHCGTEQRELRCIHSTVSSFILQQGSVSVTVVPASPSLSVRLYICLLYEFTVSTWGRRTPAKIKRCNCDLLQYQKLTDAKDSTSWLRIPDQIGLKPCLHSFFTVDTVKNTSEVVRCVFTSARPCR